MRSMSDSLARETRATILTTAAAVFMAKGYDGATMEEIAAAAGVTKRTLYKHYPQKSDVFEQVVSAGIDGFIANLGTPETYAADTNEAIALYVARFLELTACSYSIAFQRMILAASLPHAAPLLHTRGYQPAYDRLADYLHGQAGVHGDMAVLHRAAESLIEAAVGASRTAILFGSKPPLPSPPPAQAGAACDMSAIRATVDQQLFALKSHRTP
jgi:AcrR family transcriptional regulator